MSGDAGTQAGKTGDNSFIASIKSSFTKGLETIGSDVLPIWAEKQLTGQIQDQNRDPTYNANAKDAPTRADKLRAKLESYLPTVKTDVSLTPQTMVMIGIVSVAVVGVFLVTRKK